MVKERVPGEPKKSAPRANAAEQSRMADVRQAVHGLRALRREMSGRPGFKALSNKEILYSIRTGRANR